MPSPDSESVDWSRQKTQPIEHYALIGDCQTAALVGRDGSIDWMCVPRFDSPACFAALLGTADHGRWRIAPAAAATVRRRYRDGTLVLETEFETATGAVRLIDTMPLDNDRSDILRIVEGLRGKVSMRFEFIVRFDYGSIVPWVRHCDGGVIAVAGPDTLQLHSPVEMRGEGMRTVAMFEVAAGERVPFVLDYRPSHEKERPRIDAEAALGETEERWRAWSSRCVAPARWAPAVVRSLVTLKALTYRESGGIVAAPTTSLPEKLGGVRNWDYRFCWVRDATFTLNALLLAGYREEAVAWRGWLERAVAGSAADLQSFYSVTGERRLQEIELPWLPGYGGASPVRTGNAAWTQLQLDVWGEVMDTLHIARAAGIRPESHVWEIQVASLEFLEQAWQQPDEGIWEVRGTRCHFVHSKVMAWVAFDRGIRDAEAFGLEAPLETWKRTRDEIHGQVCSAGYDAERNCFVQHYGSRELDASLLLIALVGFLPPEDPRVLGTIAAIERELVVDGLVMRYATESGIDELPAGEGAFLPCTFWLADALAVTGRRDEAEALFESLLARCNDVGLLAEEIDPRSGRMLGNFPQALTHMALVNTARLLTLPGPEMERSAKSGERAAAAAKTG